MVFTKSLLQMLVPKLLWIFLLYTPHQLLNQVLQAGRFTSTYTQGVLNSFPKNLGTCCCKISLAGKLNRRTTTQTSNCKMRKESTNFIGTNYKRSFTMLLICHPLLFQMYTLSSSKKNPQPKGTKFVGSFCPFPPRLPGCGSLVFL